MTRNPLSWFHLPACLMIALIFSSPVFGALNFPVSESFETDPFALSPTSWSGFGNCTWAANISHGGSHAVYLHGASPYTQDHRLTTAVHNIPQTGLVEIEWFTYFTAFDPSNVNHIMHFGGDNWTSGMEYPVLTIGSQGAKLAVYDGRTDWDVINAIYMPLNTWIRHHVVFNQTTRRYSYWVGLGTGSEIVICPDQPLRAHIWGEGGAYNKLMIMPFVANDYYVDDITIRTYPAAATPTPGPTPTPAPTPTPTPTQTPASLADYAPIHYIRPNPPDAPLPAIHGKYYDALVPDTCDLAERMRLFVENHLVQITAPELDYEPYNIGYFSYDPPRVTLDYGDYVCGWPKFRESLALGRLMIGCEQAMQIDRAWASQLLKCIGPDGLFYVPHTGRPWDSDTPGYNWAILAGVDYYTALWTVDGRLLDTLAIFYKQAGNEVWNQTAKGIVDRLAQLAIHVGDKVVFSRFVFVPNDTLSQQEIQQTINEVDNPSGGETEQNTPLWETWIVTGLAKYYAVSGYEPARELAQGMVNYMRSIKYIETWESHFHCISLGMDCMLELAQATHDLELADYARRAYEVAKSGSRSIALPQIGFFVNSQGNDLMEGCSIADMTAIAIKLAQMGLGDQYWEDVDHYVRNCLVAGQLTTPAQLEALFRKYRDNGQMQAVPLTVSTLSDQLAQRMVGSSSGGISPIELEVGSTYITCCTGNCTRAMYYAWDAILDHDTSGVLKVNLLLNRASKWADINSYIPYIGRVDIEVKQPLTALKIRMNDWIDKSKVTCLVDDTPLTGTWENNYLVIVARQPGQTVSLRFPISERTENLKSYGYDYTAIFKGNECVDVNQKGAVWPLLQREDYRSNQPRYIQIRRFAFENSLAQADVSRETWALYN